MQIWGASNPVQYEQQRTDETNKAGDVLDKHDFLRLLTTQLRYQDPMNPIEDQDFIAQMAQFTSLEQMQNLTDQMAAFIQHQNANFVTTQAASLVGKKVTVFDEETEETVTGIVETVRFDLGEPILTVDDTSFKLGDVYEIHT